MFSPSAKMVTLSGAAVAVGVLENLHAIATNARRLAGILDAFGNPDAAAVVERHRDGIDDVRLAGDKLNLKSVRDRHSLQHFLRRKRLVRRFVLTVRNHVGIRCGRE